MLLVPFTDASESTSEFKLERDVSTNGCEASVDAGILETTFIVFTSVQKNDAR